MSKVAPAKKVSTESAPGVDPAAKGIKKFPKNPPKGDVSSPEHPGSTIFSTRRRGPDSFFLHPYACAFVSRAWRMHTYDVSRG